MGASEEQQLTLEQIRQTAVKLPLEDREDLTAALVRSLEAERDDIQQSWIELAERRLNEIRSGHSAPIPHAEVMSTIDADLGALDAERNL